MKMMIAEGNKVFYIHGLYGSRSSRKFGFIQQKYPTAICLEWKFNDNVDVFLQNTFHMLETVKDPITLIGSSVGGNFAWQIQQKLLTEGINCELILINPMIELMYKFEDNFPNHLVQYLSPMDTFSNTKVIIGLKDEVLDAHQTKAFFEMYDYNNPNKIEITLVEDDHRISNFHKLLVDF